MSKAIPSFPTALKQLVHNALGRMGYQLIKKSQKNDVRLPLQTARKLLKSTIDENKWVIFDVGANAGQTTATLLELFPQAVIHAFEPGGDAYAKLHERFHDLPTIHLYNKAVGASSGHIDLNENVEPTMSSILPLGSKGWGQINLVRQVEMTTVDEVCKDWGIEHLHILKSDTQGYDLEVLRGASEMMKQKRLDCIFIELIFSELYQNLPRFDRVFTFLLDHGFVLVGIYDMHQKQGAAAWADVLFIRRDLLPSKS